MRCLSGGAAVGDQVVRPVWHVQPVTARVRAATFVATAKSVQDVASIVVGGMLRLEPLRRYACWRLA